MWMGLHSAELNFQFDLENAERLIEEYFSSEFGQHILAKATKNNNSSSRSSGLLPPIIPSSSKSIFTQELEFNSHYFCEFIPVESLGRGGFGVVYKVQKKTDGNMYAVKRISLPVRQKEKERAMREVKALAMVNHPNIVRYYSAWIESPPLGWLEKNDPLWSVTESSSYESTTSTTAPSIQPKRLIHYIPDCHLIFELDNLKLSSSTRSIRTVQSGEGGGNDQNPEQTSTASSIQQANRTQQPVPTCSRNLLNELFDSGNNNSIANFTMPSSTRSTSTDESESGGGNDESQDKSTTIVSSYLYIQQELCQKSTLHEWLQKTGRTVDPGLAALLFSQILDAVDYFHSLKLIHRDLKPSNIFFADVANNDNLIVKIGDLGLVSDAYSDFERFTKQENVKLTSQVGTRLYMSPEQYLKKPYDYKVDIYSLGLIYFELLSHFSTDMERSVCLSDVREGRFSQKFGADFPEEVKIIKMMVSEEPCERPNAEQVKKLLNRHIFKKSGKRTSYHANPIFYDNLSATHRQ